MKKVFLLLAMGLLLTSFTTNPYPVTHENPVELQSDYCKGWEEGYCEGWKDVRGSMALCPLIPLCPLPELNKGTYRDGYNRGFKAGMAAANK